MSDLAQHAFVKCSPTAVFSSHIVQNNEVELNAIQCSTYFVFLSQLHLIRGSRSK